MSIKIGNRMRQLRKDKNMTLEELSEKSNVALATLSRMENNRMTGTLDSHVSICKSLGVSIVDLYRELEDEAKTVETVSKQHRTEHFSKGKGAKFELLVSKACDKKIMPLLVKLVSGGSTQKEQANPGVEKFLYVISGSLEAAIGKETYTLKQGDSLYFDASLPHTLNNKSKSETEAVCVVSPAAR